jgi:isopentenyl-diphosphate delta-isomerase
LRGIFLGQDRKIDHLQLATAAQTDISLVDQRFFYEPLLASHPKDFSNLSLAFGPWSLKAPLWISSMTGGTEEAAHINKNLARVAGEFGLGMGLGSCRTLLDSSERVNDFKVKLFMPKAPLLVNFGVAQIEQELQRDRSLSRILRVVDLLDADGVIIHVNPLQEWFQLSGDNFLTPPIEVIEQFLQVVKLPTIVKEVGQGFGPKSMQALMKLPLVAIELGAFGGTNFSQLEELRAGIKEHNSLSYVGHTALEMVEMVNAIKRQKPHEQMVDNFIISGGIKSFLDGFYLCQKLNACAIYGQAKIILEYARGEYDILAAFIEEQLNGYACATSFLEVKR